MSQLLAVACCSLAEITSDSVDRKSYNTSKSDSVSLQAKPAIKIRDPVIQKNTSNFLQTADLQSKNILEFTGSQITDTFLKNNTGDSVKFMNAGAMREPQLQKRSPGRNRTVNTSAPFARSCTVHLVADYLFFREVGKGNVMTTANILKDTLQGADALFRSTDFDQDGVGDNIGFLVQNITILQTYPSTFFSYTEGSSDHMQYLCNFSMADHSRYCLAIAFTNLQFQRGVWGASWIASSSPQDIALGGICQGRVSSGSVVYSFNTVVITFTNDGQQLSQEAAVRVLTHELGHSFGSAHDEDNLTEMCNSSRQKEHGMYMMNEYMTAGLRSNNYRFSTCSLRLMYPVIVHRASCLQQHLNSQCGNGLVEDGEECDCGNSDICDYNDPCCTPGNAANDSTDPPCTLRRSQGKVCSPLSGSCCLTDCQVSGDASWVCDEATECHDRSLCDGRSGQCPPAAVKPNGTLCGGGSRFCVGGQCVGNVCHSHGFFACRCTSPPGHRCELCCKANVTSQCLPAQRLGIVNEQGLPINLTAGEPCSDTFPAFCDKRHVCVPHLMLAAPSTLSKSSAMWFRKYWPYLLILLLAAVFAVLFKFSFRLKDAHMKSVQYGKMIGIFRIANSVGLRNMQNVAVTRYLFDRFHKKAAKGKLQMHYVEAVSRVRTLFPTCPLSHITIAVTMASSEDVVVRMLLSQGFPIRRFMSRISECKFAHLSNLFLRTQLPLGRKITKTASSEHMGSAHGHFSASERSVLGDFSSASSLSASRTYSTSATSSSMGSDLDRDRRFMNAMTEAVSDFSSLYLKHFETELSHSRQMLKELSKGKVSSERSEKTLHSSIKGSDSQVDRNIDLLDKTSSLLTHLQKTALHSKHAEMKTSKKNGILKSIPHIVQSDEKSDVRESRDKDGAVRVNIREENDKDKQKESVTETKPPYAWLSKLKEQFISEPSPTRGRVSVSQNLFKSWFGAGISKDDQKTISLDSEQKGEHGKPPSAQVKQNGKTIPTVCTIRSEIYDGEIPLEIHPPTPPRLSLDSVSQPSTSPEARIPTQLDALHPSSISIQRSSSEYSSVSSSLYSSDSQQAVSFQHYGISLEPSTSKQSRIHLNVPQQSRLHHEDSHDSVDQIHPMSSLVTRKEAHGTRHGTILGSSEDVSAPTSLSAVDIANMSYGVDFVDVHMDSMPQTMMPRRDASIRRKSHHCHSAKSKAKKAHHQKTCFHPVSTKNPSVEQFQ